MLKKRRYPRLQAQSCRRWRGPQRTPNDAWAPLAAILLLLVGCEGFVAQEAGQAVRVLDGDSLVLTIDGRQTEARLQGIDAPERHQPYAEQAKRELRELVSGHPIEVRVTDTDRYGRSVVLLRRADSGLFINEELIRRGAAWSHRRYGLPGWRQLESEAKRARRGLWAQKDPLPPWEWRQRNPRR